MTAAQMPGTADLIHIGRQLAALSDPDKDLLRHATDLREIATTLQMLADGMERVYDAISEAVLGSASARDAAARFEADERGHAARTGARTLVDLSRWVAEMEAPR